MRRLIVTAAAVTPVLFLIFVWRAPWISLAVLAASHAALLYATLRPNVQWLGPVITCFEPSGRELWLTIDDGPLADTPALLDLLAARGAVATFFVKGELAEGNPDHLRAIVTGGHSIGNHSQTHPSATFWCLPRRAIQRQVDECNSTIEKIAGNAPSMFRAPVGMKNPFVHPALERSNMLLIGWSIRAFDAVMSDVDSIARGVRKQLRPGAIIVLHQGRDWSVRTIDQVVTAALEDGYRFVVPDASRLKTKR